MKKIKWECPECGGTDIAHFETVETAHNVELAQEGGHILFHMSPMGYSPGARQRLECLECGKEVWTSEDGDCSEYLSKFVVDDPDEA